MWEWMLVSFTFFMTVVAVATHFFLRSWARELVAERLRMREPIAVNNLFTPAVRRAASRRTNNTPDRARYIDRVRHYEGFHGEYEPAAAMARIGFCFVCCQSGKLVVEHCHLGFFRGPACYGCNAKEREAIAFTRRHFQLSRHEYEAGQMSWSLSLWYLHAAAFENHLGYSRSFEFCFDYVTGLMWRRRKHFFKKDP